MSNLPQTIIKQTKAEIGIGITVSILTAALIWFQMEKSQVQTWLLLVTTIYAVRYGLCDYLSKRKPNTKSSKSIRFLLNVGLLICGLAWASLIINEPFHTGSGTFNSYALVAAGFLSFIVFMLYLGKLDLVLTFVTASLFAPILNSVLRETDPDLLTISCILLWTVCLVVASIRFSKIASTSNIKIPDTTNEAALKQNNEQLQRKHSVAEAKIQELQAALKMANLDLESSQNKADALSITLNQINPFDLESGLLTEVKHKNILQREWARMARLNLPITLIYLLLDDYDKYEEMRDKKTCLMTLKRIVKIIKSTCRRPGDVFAKLKNQQLALLLPETDLEDSIELANSICKQVEDLQIPHVKNSPNPILTVSLGIATVIPNELLTEGEFLKRADSALYEAKFQGGNRVVHYVSHPEIKLEHWDVGKLGAVSADKLKHKLTTLGYDTETKTYLPGGQIKDRRTHTDFATGILAGTFLLTIDGDAVKLRPGDCLVIPKSLNILSEVIGTEPVICYEGNH